MIKIDIISFATVITILIGSYIIATAILQWSFCSAINCAYSFANMPHKITLPTIFILLIISVFGVVVDYMRFIKSFEVYDIIILFMLLLISYFVIFRSIFLFKKIPKWGWLLLLCFVAIHTLGDSILRYKENPILRFKQMLDDKMILIMKQEERRNLIADNLTKILDERINEIEACKNTVTAWGQGPERTWLSMIDWIHDDTQHQWSMFDILARSVQNLNVLILLTIYFAWLLPVSFVAGRLGGFIYLKICPEIKCKNIEGNKILLIHTPDCIVVADSREPDSVRTYLSGDSINHYVVLKKEISSAWKSIYLVIKDFLFSRR